LRLVNVQKVGGFWQSLTLFWLDTGVAWLEFDLFLIFTALVFFLQKGFMTPYGLVYLLSLGLAVGVTIRMRKTVDAMPR